MAVSSFIPEIWSARILDNLNKAHVYAALCNRDYEGEIKNAGDTVHVNSLTDVTIGTYSGTLSTPETLTTTDATMAIDQAKYFNFMLDDVDKVQALPGLLEKATQSAAYGLADESDKYIAGIMATGGHALTGTTVAITSSNAYTNLIDMKVDMDENNVPNEGRWVVITPAYHGLLLQDARFVGYGTDFNRELLTNGRVGRAAGFDIYVSNNVPEASSVYTIIAGVNAGCSYAEQLIETEALRYQGAFADVVRGLHVYGAKVFQTNAIETCPCSF